VRRLEDAAAVEAVFQEEPDEWRAWSMNATEGEMAALLYRVSKHEAEFRIQLPDLKMARDLAQWTSRKIRE
jgi:oxalate---CoA ligase